ncbi:vWA domain-containing protein [Thalassovita mangrovi]|uniref:VWA domain-containing protein n=1 Tax=Thalassovita mangrovi TaxID=2692236 RepID=A0A6L8LJ65_9RHOB|nr:VWA domain-containing protein [Thalassovita mangrovi]MYM55994.1 VWA domain-containing protein [Thalassovita mangrovi]
MSRVTKFAARDAGPAARMAGFMAHLRQNGLRLGVAETETALAALTQVNAADPDQARHALKAVCAGNAEEAEQFDDLFNAFWLDAGRVRTRAVPKTDAAAKDHVHSSRDGAGEAASGAGTATAPDGGEGAAESDGEGRLIAARTANLMKKDLRDLVRPEDIAEAELVARRLGLALNHRRSRRRKAALKGDRLHFRKLIRHSLSTGGEPLRLPMKQRPDRPLKVVALCDVSGSMGLYAQVFLSFMAGLMRADPATDAYLFHTRLVRIADALRDPDPLRAVGRMSLLAEGFGGGSKIGASLTQFARSYARRFVDGRTVVLILSDGYDTDPPEDIAEALAALKKRGCKIIWLNPLKGWDGYEAVARGMSAALPYIDLFRPANRLVDLAALEPELTRL